MAPHDALRVDDPAEGQWGAVVTGSIKVSQ